MAERRKKPVVIFLGKLPPPWIGPALAARVLLKSKLNEDFRLVHLDMSDHRDTHTLGRWDLVNLWLALKQYALLKWLILKHRPVLVYIPAGQTNVGYLRDAGFILISKLLGRKVICHLRGGNFLNWYQGTTSLMQSIVRFVHRKVDGQIVLADSLRPLFSWILPEEKIFTVPNGMDIPDKGRRPSEGPLRVLYLSNYIRSKGVMEVLEAAKMLNDKGLKVQFRLAGGWNEKDTELEIKNFLQENPALDIRLSGPVSGEEKETLLRESDVFVLPTYYPNEGLPWALIEAMAHRLPLVSTRHAAVPSCLEEGVNGFFVNKKDASSLATALEKFIADPGLSLSLGDASRERYERYFTEQAMILGLKQAFIKTIGE
jgi:glycosyltransferase involved in cell wall biosynthesis